MEDEDIVIFIGDFCFSVNIVSICIYFCPFSHGFVYHLFVVLHMLKYITFPLS